MNQRTFKCSTRDHGRPQNHLYSLSHNETMAVMEALDHFYVSRIYQDIGLCVLCRKICSSKCKTCGALYCCSECQIADWPRHKSVCIRSQDNRSDCVSLSSFQSTTRSSSENSGTTAYDKGLSNENLNTSNCSSPFGNFLKQMTKKSESSNLDNSFTSNKFSNESKSNDLILKKPVGKKKHEYTKTTYCNDNNSNNNNNNNNSGKDWQFMSSPKILNENNTEKKDRFSKGTKNNQKFDRDASPLKSIENIPDLNKKNLTSDTSTLREVVCMYRASENRYWVMDTKDVLRYGEIQSVLSKESDDFAEVTPKVGQMYACIFSGQWYRAKVVSLSPKVFIHFVDYGNTEEYSSPFKKLPEKLECIPELVFLLEFERGTPSQYKYENLDTMNLTIKETRKTFEGVVCAETVTGCFGPTAFSPKSNISTGEIEEVRHKTVFDSLTENTEGVLFLTPGQGKVRFGSVIPKGENDALRCLEKILKLTPTSPVTKVKEGDFVLISDTEGHCERGKVISMIGNLHYVYLIDSGNIIASSAIHDIPEDTKNLMELGGMITIDDSCPSIDNIDLLNFKITGPQSQGKWPCILRMPEDETVMGHGILEKSSDTLESFPKHVEIPSNSTVVLTSICAPNVFYIRSVNNAVEEKLRELNMQLSQISSTAESYSSPPIVGELCCAKFSEDGCYYRSQVKKVKGNVVTIVFVDFGNEQETAIEELKRIPNSMKQVPFLGVKVKLAKVPDRVPSETAINYMEKLLILGLDLVITYKDSLDEVVLSEKKSQISVNDRIMNDLINENSCISSLRVSSKVFTNKDLSYASLTPGSSNGLCLLHVNRKEFELRHSFWATRADTETMMCVYKDLGAKISQHCEGDTKPYKPKPNEVCLAEFEGGWYRALTVKQLETSLFKLWFLDFGNYEEVQSEFIRKIKEEFVRPPVLALSCVVDGYEKFVNDSNKKEQILKYLSSKVNAILIDVKILKFENDSYTVSLPELNDIL